MAHKPDKGSAHRIQKRPKSFDIQSARQVNDRRKIEMVMEELSGRPRWDYFVAFERFEQELSPRIRKWHVQRLPEGSENASFEPILKPKLSGVRADFAYVGDRFAMTSLHTAMKKKHKFEYPPSIVQVLEELANDVADYASGLPVYSELIMSGGQTYRASPYFQGKPWYD